MTTNDGARIPVGCMVSHESWDCDNVRNGGGDNACALEEP